MWDAEAPLVNHRHVSPKDRERLEQWVAMLTAGDAAAETLTGRRWPALCMDDKGQARMYVSRYLPEIIETIDVEIERQRREAMSFFALDSITGPGPTSIIELAPPLSPSG